ncbi:thioredoxin domain-containing protein [Saliniramus sp.]|uniref:thioredoxin domain-containing protein n=1 Tax=Saliniramus sp. TaxID=2986772 RepID=UPI002CE94232|nr:thioredoxin domain-containing protein [Saliniramus sp.]HMB11266.1 thioredoxin domain-containing protein [Saliniramus sp.]
MPFSSRLQLSRRDLLTGFVTLPAASVIGLPAQARDARRVPYELVEDALALPGAAYVGAEHPDVMMVEFFDYNCPFCRQSAQDMDQLLDIDEHLGYVLVNYAILGEPSVEATRIALAFQGLYGNDHYRDFHLALYALRGVKNGQRALDVAMELGADGHALVEFADSDLVTMAMQAAISAGNNLNINATPSFAIGPWVYDGQVPLDGKLRIIDALRA